MAKQVFTTGQILTAAQMTTLQANDYNQTVSAKTANYTLVAADAGTRITMNNAGATTITVNTGVFTAGDTLIITNIGVGVCTITAGTATVSTSSTLALKQYDSGQLYFTSTGVAIFFASDAADSPLTTKGDLFTFSTQDARLAVGNNGETLVADSSTATGLRYQSAYNGNVLINGGQDIWQRGTSFTTTAAYVYCSDRWYYSTSSGGKTVSRQATGDTTNLPNIQYCVRLARNSGQTDTTGYSFHTALETADSIPFAGQTVTFSFYARKGANFSGTTVATYLNTGTGTDQAATGQNSGTWTGFTSPINGSTFTPTTTWTRYSFTVTIGATATQIGLGFLTSVFSGTAGAADYVEITGLQLERGSVATTFKRSNGAGGTIQGELAACQRYLPAFNSNSSGSVISGGYFNNTTSFRGIFTYQVQPRVAPTGITISNTGHFTATDGGADYVGTNLTFSAANLQTATINCAISGATISRAGMLFANNASAQILFTGCEL